MKRKLKPILSIILALICLIPMFLSGCLFGLNTYTIIVECDDECINFGTVTGGGEYKSGEEITINAIANAGYKFVCWNDGDVNAERTIVVNQNKTYIAEFRVASYAVDRLELYTENVEDDVTYVYMTEFIVACGNNVIDTYISGIEIYKNDDTYFSAYNSTAPLRIYADKTSPYNNLKSYNSVKISFIGYSKYDGHTIQGGDSATIGVGNGNTEIELNLCYSKVTIKIRVYFKEI